MGDDQGDGKEGGVVGDWMTFNIELVLHMLRFSEDLESEMINLNKIKGCQLSKIRVEKCLRE